jgi:hypothetical protein
VPLPDYVRALTASEHEVRQKFPASEREAHQRLRAFAPVYRMDPPSCPIEKMDMDALRHEALRLDALRTKYKNAGSRKREKIERRMEAVRQRYHQLQPGMGVEPMPRPVSLPDEFHLPLMGGVALAVGWFLLKAGTFFYFGGRFGNRFGIEPFIK